MSTVVVVPWLLRDKRAGSEDYAWFASRDCPGDRADWDNLRERFDRGNWIPSAQRQRVRAVFSWAIGAVPGVAVVSQTRNVRPPDGGRVYHRTRIALLTERELVVLGGFLPALEALEAAAIGTLPALASLRFSIARVSSATRPKCAAPVLQRLARHLDQREPLRVTDESLVLSQLSALLAAQPAWCRSPRVSLLDAGAPAEADAYAIQVVGGDEPMVYLASPRTPSLPSPPLAEGARPMSMTCVHEGEPDASAVVLALAEPSDAVHDELWPTSPEEALELPLRPMPWRWIGLTVAALCCVAGLCLREAPRPAVFGSTPHSEARAEASEEALGEPAVSGWTSGVREVRGIGVRAQRRAPRGEIRTTAPRSPVVAPTRASEPSEVLGY